jgi:hypothetical protein
MERLVTKKREPTMHVQTDGPEKTNDADVTIAAHAICVRTTMLSLASKLKVSQVFSLQDA